MEAQIQSWVGIISQVGFPIVVASYLLLRMERTLKENTRLMTELVHEIKVALERFSS